ncbi:hypothetical protein EJB05_30164 [Eragrostis curvula]|uniref:Uncharacterized protein n=1 Tax=Eragrostis curvula TaxID=38414 RepID=A0A5J9UVD8_9POAL|nr:hypothetical protein EJB05_30164 [Eragrostis curvula]
MGNILRCFEGEEDHAGGDHYPYYRPTSRPHYQPLQYYSHDQPPAAPPPRPHQQALDPHGVMAATIGVDTLDQCILNFKSASMAAVPNIGPLQRSSEVLANRMVPPQYKCNTEDIDESSAKGLCDAESYAKANPMLIQVPVLGTTRKFWRLSDKATRISRKLALILRSHHSVGKYLTTPLQVSNVWISSAGSVKLRGVRFIGKRFSIQCVRDDYRHLSRVLQGLIRVSGGDITKLPPDYKEFLALLESDNLTMKDEFLIVNYPALLPMSNRTEVYLMLYDRIVTYLGRNKTGRAKKKRRILSKLPYKNDWLDTASANTQINRWVVNVQQQYKRTQLDQLRLNRNVRSHLHQYNDDNIEEIMYCEWPELLMDMAKMLHMEGELQGTDIENKFG